MAPINLVESGKLAPPLLMILPTQPQLAGYGPVSNIKAIAILGLWTWAKKAHKNLEGPEPSTAGLNPTKIVHV